MKSAITAILAISLCAFAAEKEKPKAGPVAAQPAVETLDLETIARIRDEGMMTRGRRWDGSSIGRSTSRRFRRR